MTCDLIFQNPGQMSYGSTMKIECRVYKDRKLIFRSSFPLFKNPTIEHLNDLSTETLLAFNEKYPAIDLRDESVRIVWCEPQEPLLC